MQTPARLVAAAVLSLTLLATSACGDSGDDEAADPQSPSVSSSDGATDSSEAPPATGAECTVEDISVEGEFGAEPTIGIPDDCSPPSTLLSEDLVTGSGPAAEAGSNVEANYHLVTWSDRQVLDSSFARGAPFTVENLGQAMVIDGWNQGLIGIQKGTRRLLVVPPDLGYGQGGQGVQPNETLVFVIDAVSIS